MPAKKHRGDQPSRRRGKISYKKKELRNRFDSRRNRGAKRRRRTILEELELDSALDLDEVLGFKQ